jgi:hypothetical protein
MNKVLLVGALISLCIAGLFRLPLDIELDRRMKDYGTKDSIPTEIVK